MHRTNTPIREGRSLRGVIAAGSTLGAIAGPVWGTLRLGPVVFDGDKVTITADDVTDAQGLAAALGLGPDPISHHAESHDWTGDCGGLFVTVRGSGFLPDRIPVRLRAAVYGGIPAQGDAPCPVCGQPWRGHDNDACERIDAAEDAADFAALSGTSTKGGAL